MSNFKQNNFPAILLFYFIFVWPRIEAHTLSWPQIIRGCVYQHTAWYLISDYFILYFARVFNFDKKKTNERNEWNWRTKKKTHIDNTQRSEQWCKAQTEFTRNCKKIAIRLHTLIEQIQYFIRHSVSRRSQHCHTRHTQNDILIEHSFPISLVHFETAFLSVGFCVNFFRIEIAVSKRMFESLEVQFYVAAAVLGTVCVLLIFFMAGICGALTKLKRLDRQRQQELEKHVALW